MDAKVRLGRWVLLTIIVITVLSELAVAGLSIQAGRFKGSHIGRALLTVWLLWRVWDGAGWARWLLAALFLVTALFAATIGLAFPAAQERPEVVALFVVVGAVCVAFGVGLASPWVGAYQAARRGGKEAEPVAAPDPARASGSE